MSLELVATETVKFKRRKVWESNLHCILQLYSCKFPNVFRRHRSGVCAGKHGGNAWSECGNGAALVELGERSFVQLVLRVSASDENM
jgi:hypothetical protein